MAARPKSYHVTYQYTDPEPQWIDFEGEHFMITGALAWFYRALKIMNCEETARKELYPYLKSALKAELEKREAAADRHRAAAQAQQGINI